MSRYEEYLEKVRAAESHDERVSWTLMALLEITIVHTQEIEELRSSVKSLKSYFLRLVEEIKMAEQINSLEDKTEKAGTE